jgi:DNA-binding GntR family transcriptional regulator
MLESQFRGARPSALSDWVYTTIKDAILHLQFPPGIQLHVDELADKMGTSRTPIREALLRLEKDGLVRTVPRVGVFVTQITRNDLKELFEIRQLLEDYAVKSATPLLTEEDLAYMERLWEENVNAVELGDRERFLRAEIGFHTYLVDRATNRHLSAIMESLRDLTYRERVLSMQSEDNLRNTLTEHRRILDALHKRDAELAGSLMAQHLGDARDRILQLLDSPDKDTATASTTRDERT